MANDDYKMNIRIPQELRMRFQRLLEKNNMVASKLIRSYIEKWVEQHERAEREEEKRGV